MKIMFHYPPTFPFINPKTLKALVKTFPTKMKSTKCPVKENKIEARKAKKEGRRESKTAVTFKPQKICEILLSAHAHDL